MQSSVTQTWTPHEYQKTVLNFLHSRTTFSTNAGDGAGVLLDPGMGKTACVLQWIADSVMLGVANRFLIVAPKAVCHLVWPSELQKWTNFRHLTHSVCMGQDQARRRKLSVPANVSIINHDALDWLARLTATHRRLPWHGIVIDESTNFRNVESRRTKALAKLIAKIPRRVILTGTPAPKNLADLYPQLYMLDQGAALGPTVEQFRASYCFEAGSGGRGSTYHVRQDRLPQFYQQIQPLCLRLEVKDYLSMPELITHDIPLELEGPALRAYEDMEEMLFLELEEGNIRAAANASARYQLCKQIAAGFLYDENRAGHPLHSTVVDSVLGILQELAGKPALIAYQYTYELEMLRKRIPKLHAIRGGMRPAEVSKLVQKWNEDKLDPPYLAVHPAALSFGVNMQAGSGRDIIWTSPTDNLIDYLQLNARIHRQGVTSSVRIHRPRVVGTVCDMVWDRTDAKENVQDSLLQVLKEYAQTKRR